MTLVAMGLLASCVPMTSYEAVQNTNIRAAAKNARTRGDHDALIKHHEDSSREMQAKANEQKKLLEQYEKEQLYGWQAHKSKSQTQALIRKYEQAARSEMKEAVPHRQIVSGPEKSNYVTPNTLGRDLTLSDN